MKDIKIINNKIYKQAFAEVFHILLLSMLLKIGGEMQKTKSANSRHIEYRCSNNQKSDFSSLCCENSPSIFYRSINE